MMIKDKDKDKDKDQDKDQDQDQDDDDDDDDGCILNTPPASARLETVLIPI